MKNATSVSSLSGLSQFRLTELKTLVRFPHSLMIGDRLQNFWRYLVAVWWYSEEPRVYHQQDRKGNWYYHIYDPITHQHFICDSETEAQIWLEKRYHQ